MGCLCSKDKSKTKDSKKGGANEKSDEPKLSPQGQKFMDAVTKQKHPLAIAIKNHWDKFMKEQTYKKQGNDDTYKHMKSTRAKNVKAVKSVEEANKLKLNEDAIETIAKNFVAYALDVLKSKKWGGDFEYDVDGILGKAGTLKIKGQVNFFKDNNKLEDAYDVTYDLFIMA